MSVKGSWIGVVIACAVACNDADNTRKMRDLSTEELRDECEKYLNDIGALSDATCTLDGLGAGDREACEETRATCIQSGNGLLDCDDVNASDLEDCDLGVFVVARCLQEAGDWARGLSCEDGAAAPEPPSCLRDVADRCPIFAGL